MKNIKYLILLGFAVIMGGSFTACSEDDDNNKAVSGTVEIINMGSYDLALLDEQDYVETTIEFSATSSWRLYSDKMWVLFSKDGGAFYNDIRGVAGTHTVTMRITNDARTFEPSGANVAFAAGKNEFPFGPVYRHAKNYESSVLDENDNVVEYVAIDGNASTTVGFNCNFVYGIKAYPDWLEEPVYSEGKYSFRVISEYTPFEKEGEIVIADEAGSVEHTYPVKFDGMFPNSIEISGDYSAWNWEISLDGKEFINEGSSVEGDNNDIAVQDALVYNVKCRNYEFKSFFIAENNDNSFTVMDEPWLVAEQSADDKGVVTVTAEPFEATTTNRSRKGCLFAFPVAAYDSIVLGADTCTLAETFIDNNISFVIVEAVQKDIYAPEGFFVAKSDGTQLACDREPAGDALTLVSSELLSTPESEDVYAVAMEYGQKYTINTLCTTYEYPKAADVAYAFFNDKTEGLSFRTQVTMNAEGYYEITFTMPTADKFASYKSEFVTLCMRNTLGQNTKVLIIRPVNN